MRSISRAFLFACGLSALALGTAEAKSKTVKAVAPLAAAAKKDEPKTPEKKAESKDPKATALAEKVQSFYEKTQDLSADVDQAYTYAAMHNTQRASGKMQLKKPGMLRWDIVKPYPKQYVVEGEKLVVYDGEDNEYIERKDFSADTLSAAVTFLWGRGQLTREFDVAMAQKPEYGPTVLELVPKKPDAFKRLYFAVDPETGVVQKSVVIDNQDNENKLTFTNVKTNLGLDSSLFHFTPPPGAKKQDVKVPTAPR